MQVWRLKKFYWDKKIKTLNINRLANIYNMLRRLQKMVE